MSDNGREMVTHPKQSARPTAWVCPPDDWIEINVDGSFVEQTGEAGVGVIARNNKGDVIFSAWRVLFRCTYAVEAEACACVEGFRLAAEWACQRPIIVESDCARVVEAMRKKKDSSSLSFIFKEALEHAQLLETWRVEKVKRECNFVAHNLAQLARRNRHIAVWLRQAPACVLDLIKDDCNSRSV